uniref:NAD-dependent epimerase/dehydratase n=1 Tax=Solibacter usitatus (strain Ellin6076) TaxID=234267 RepID=Q028X8_SOLUE
MKVFVTGATGYIGSVVSERLRDFGHHVVALARSPDSAAKLNAAGAQPVRGDLRDTSIVLRAAREADAAIHIAQEHSAEAARLDRSLVDTVLEEYRLTGRPFIYTSGIWVTGDTGGREADETWPVNPTPLVAWRPAHEQLVLETQGPRGIVIRPAVVYGRSGGMIGALQRQGREEGVVRYIGDGENHWPFVHLDDLADLYVLALQAPAGSLYFASAGPAIPVRKIAEAIGPRAESITLEAARAFMGPVADALALDQRISSRKAMQELGWTPKSKSVIEELG